MLAVNQSLGIWPEWIDCEIITLNTGGISAAHNLRILVGILLGLDALVGSNDSSKHSTLCTVTSMLGIVGLGEPVQLKCMIDPQR